MLFLALSKELHINSKVALAINSTETNLPIPAGEAGVSLAIDTVIHNLDDQDFSDCKLYLFIPENFGWNDLPEKCTKFDDISKIPKEVEVKRSITSSKGYVLCNLGTMTSYEKRNFKITLTIENYKATQTKYQVTILDSITYFINTNKEIISMANYVKANCENAPTLRVSANIDPSSVYPILGVGQYFDNVIRIENKEQSTAYDVEYTGIIPIISPLLNSDDQRATQWNLKIYADYYNKNNFEVPFDSDNATDYIVPASLQGKGVYMVSEWDGPVLPIKQLISKELADENKEALKKELDLKGINQGMITINDNTEIIKQINYRKSDRFYKLASQRLMVFVDDSTPDGAKTLYGDNIPKDIIDPILGDRAKKNFIFMRNDIFFYDNKNYCNPPFINEKILFSVDKLIDYENKNCVDKRGEAKSTIHKKGFFSNKNHPEIIHEPDVYTNEMFNYCNLNIINPTNEEDIISNFGNLEFFRPVHYIVPNVVNHIISSEQIYDFVQDNGNFGHHKDYDFIKFIYVHSLNFIIESENCLYGGKIIINLANYKINSVDEVTLAPDQIAIYKKIYTDNKIFIYFKRGLMSNEQFGKKLNLVIYIENIIAENKNEIELEITLEEMKYDISYYPDLERYSSLYTKKVKLNYISAFSYPALEIKSNLNRTLNGYEMIEPFSRYGIYSQELGHRYVYATLEAHNEKKPGLVGSGTGFSLITNLGISSIPFIEYLTVGKGQIIPGSISTSRIAWKDVWGRTWHQPIRSLFADSVPIPPPLKNFMMTTTYKMIRKNEIINEWPSDENIKIQLKVKLLNNYPKYFEITRCKENKIRFIPENLDEGHFRDYTEKCSADIKDTEIPNSDKIFLREGGYASYGACFTDSKSIVGGKKVEGELLEKIKKAKFCAAYTDGDSIAKCEEDLKDITTLHKIDEAFNKTNIWNYSPQVESYYPKGYIEKDMWDLTHVDYDDSNMDKAYKYHVDNLLPNYDNSIIKPHNVIAVPIYKGLGYIISYDKNSAVTYHNWQRKGWWPDNLQNRDDTLLGGQEICNNISVDKEKRSIENWIHSKDLVGINDTTTETVKKIIANRNKNIYVCLFGRKRPAFPKNTQRKYYAGNININNVIPIFVDLEANDERLTNYNCGNEQYDDSAKLSEIDGNYLETPTSKDYLYFAASLRGHAKESFNVLLNLQNFKNIKYEGMTKINEGGRFVYWNPVNGPNSFLTVDNPTSIINAKRNDIEITNKLIPTVIPTFNAVIYYAFSIKDENKINKEWPFYEFYENSYGFEDVTIKVHVGGINKSKAVIQPGSTTYASIIIYNNCGYDLNMKVTAIDFEEKEKMIYNANDLLLKLVHTVRKPVSYNFFNYTVEEELKQYITIVPSDHNINVAPEFFDFENINVVTIRDGFKGEYSLKITVDKNFPKEYRGKPIEIKIGLNTNYFDHFPGTPTDLAPSLHKYTITIPSVYIAIPFSEGEFSGKVLYTSAQAKNLQLTFSTWMDCHLVDVKYTDKKTIEKMFEATDSKENVKRMDEIWQKIDNSTKPKVELLGKYKNFTFEEKYPLFPVIVKGSPDIAEMYILIKFNISQIQFGSRNPFNDNQIKYYDWIGKQKTNKANDPYLYAEGAWIILNYDIFMLVDKLPNGTFVKSLNQELSHESDGYAKIKVRLYNYGNGNSYNTSYTIALEPRFEFVSYNYELGIKDVKQIKDSNTNTTNITLFLNSPIPAGNSRAFFIYLKYNKVIESYNNLTNDEIDALPKTVIASRESSTKMQLTKNGDNEVTQYLRKSLAINYQIVKQGAKVYIDLVISGKRSNPTIEIKPKIYLENENIDSIFMDIMKSDLTKYKEKSEVAIPDKYIIKNGQHVENVEDSPISKENSNKEHVVLYTVYIKKSNCILTTNKMSYIQKDIGLSTWEVVLIIISIIFFTLALIFIWFGITNIKKSNSGDNTLLTKVEDENLDKLLI